MQPIQPGYRGPAVEDVQRRLLILGYDLGRTGVDGVFLGATREAVATFQAERGLSEDGIVGPQTWAALVDSTFTLGDRMLYLRLPHFHGRDVRVLQEALNALGFASGQPDGIFGVYCERAVREFQRNCGQLDDGIVGPETVRALRNLRHVWEGKDAGMPTGAMVGVARSVEPLRRIPLDVIGRDRIARDVAVRFLNAALASEPQARVALAETVTETDSGIVLQLGVGLDVSVEGVPLVALGDDSVAALAARIITALAARQEERGQILVDLSGTGSDEHELQRAAVRLLDGVCLALA